MKVEILVLGPLDTNTYILSKDGKCIIIDPADDAEKIVSFCSKYEVEEIIVTHHHFDHIGALDELKKYYKLEENVKSGMFDYEVIKTPGHTSDSRSIYFKNEKVMFTGDFLFYRSIGRTDLDTGSDIDMIKSLEKISKYPDDIVIYPGHGPKSTLGREKNNFKYYY